eukprot:m.197408 g.197408  ORF g.197408 m.197408 type:complete len:369 (+) comp18718_c0_seq1:330-1436(+)
MIRNLPWNSKLVFVTLLVGLTLYDVTWGQGNCTDTSDCIDLVQFCDVPVNDTEGICGNCTACFSGQACVVACSGNVTASSTTFTSTTPQFTGVRISTFNYDDPDPDHKLLQVIVPILAFLLFFAFACCAMYRPDDCHELWNDMKRECTCWMVRHNSSEDGGESRRDLVARRRQARQLREQAELNELLGVQGLRDAAVAAAHGDRGEDDRVRGEQYAAAAVAPIYNDAGLPVDHVAGNRNQPELPPLNANDVHLHPVENNVSDNSDANDDTIDGLHRAVSPGETEPFLSAHDDSGLATSTAITVHRLDSISSGDISPAISIAWPQMPPDGMSSVEPGPGDSETPTFSFTAMGGAPSEPLHDHGTEESSV